MAEKTGISWTNATVNFWRGCTKISPGCKNCYMFREQSRYGRNPAEVIRCGKSIWQLPYKLQRQAEREGKNILCFTCSWSDFFHQDADAWREEAWQVIKDTPNIIYQVLTKRVDLVADRLPANWGYGYHNVWLGVSIEREDYAWRADLLRKIPARIRFISAEPLLGSLSKLNLRNIDWLITGGESGPNFREMKEDWAIELLEKCKAIGTAFFHKQGSGFLPGKNTILLGREWQEFPE